MSVSHSNTKGLPGLSHYRKLAGYTQEAFADKVGLHRVTIAQYESGQQDPTLSKLRRFARTLNCTTDNLLTAPSYDGAEVSGTVAE